MDVMTVIFLWLAANRILVTVDGDAFEVDALTVASYDHNAYQRFAYRYAWPRQEYTTDLTPEQMALVCSARLN